MGTEIQDRKFDETEFRGDRFQKVECSQAGNNDLLILSQPDYIREVHPGICEPEQI